MANKKALTVAGWFFVFFVSVILGFAAWILVLHGYANMTFVSAYAFYVLVAMVFIFYKNRKGESNNRHSFLDDIPYQGKLILLICTIEAMLFFGFAAVISVVSAMTTVIPFYIPLIVILFVLIVVISGRLLWRHL